MSKNIPLPDEAEDDSVAWQKYRFQIYALATAVVGLLIASNIIDQAVESQVMEIVNRVLTIVGLFIPLWTNIMARRNANPKSVAVLPIAATRVETVQTVDGETVAGPASDRPTGDVIDRTA